MPAGSGRVITVATVMLLLMSRTPLLLERRVGSDVLARWHAHGGRLFMGLVLAHAGAAVQAWASGRGRTWLRRSSLCSAYLGWSRRPSVPAHSGGHRDVGMGHPTSGLLRDVARDPPAHLRRRRAVVPPRARRADFAARPVLQVLWTLMHAYPLAFILRYRVLAPRCA
jgi:hypothetical protein